MYNTVAFLSGKASGNEQYLLTNIKLADTLKHTENNALENVPGNKTQIILFRVAFKYTSYLNFFRNSFLLVSHYVDY